MDSLSQLEVNPETLRPELLVDFAANNKIPQVKAIVEKYPDQVCLISFLFQTS